LSVTKSVRSLHGDPRPPEKPRYPDKPPPVSPHSRSGEEEVEWEEEELVDENEWWDQEEEDEDCIWMKAEQGQWRTEERKDRVRAQEYAEIERTMIAGGGGAYKYQAGKCMEQLEELPDLVQNFVQHYGEARGEGSKRRLYNIKHSRSGPPIQVKSRMEKEVKNKIREAEERYRSKLVELDKWLQLLDGYPSRLEVLLWVDQTVNGGYAGYEGERTGLQYEPSAAKAVQRDEEKEEMTGEEEELKTTIRQELDHGHQAGPFAEPPFQDGFVCSGFRLPKKKYGRKVSGKARTITWPKRVNENTPRWITMMVPWGTILSDVIELGRGCLWFKEDIEAAFRRIKYRWQDLPLFIMYTRGVGYTICTRLCMGTRTSPPLWERETKLLKYIWSRVAPSIRVRVYVDDYMGADGRKDKNLTIRDQMKIQEVSNILNAGVSREKSVRPGTETELLGVITNTDRMSLTLHPERIKVLKEELEALAYPKAKHMSRKRLEALAGSLIFLAKVIPAIRCCIGRIYRQLELAKTLNLKGKTGWLLATISAGMTEDALIMLKMLERPEQPIRRALLPNARGEGTHASATGATDASTSYGGGAVLGRQWVSFKWTPEEMREAERQSGEHSITYLESLVVLYILRAKGKEWSNHAVKLLVDNKGVVDATNRGKTTSQGIGEIVRGIMLKCWEYNIHLILRHIPGRENVAADHFSRGRIEKGCQAMGTEEQRELRIEAENRQQGKGEAKNRGPSPRWRF
jgi:hypothetical protein